MDGGNVGFGGNSGEGLSQKESVEWHVTTQLLSLDQLPTVSLRLELRATESCPEHLVSYQTCTTPI